MKGSTIEGNLVDVVGDRIYPAIITVEGGRVTNIEEVKRDFQRYILPGLIDSHVHVESSLLVPSRFAEAAIPHGLTAVVTDPHEIANVLGIEGIEFMVADGKGVPLKFHFTVPSCVPATPWETSGAMIKAEDVDRLMDREEIVALGEMMNYPGVLNGDPEVMAKIESALSRGKPVDGHAPGLRGDALDRYISAGISTDHECTTLDEAIEKSQKGVLVQIREGSAAKNMEDLIGITREHEFFLATDDVHAADILNGYMDRLLRKIVSLGVDPLRAIKAASLWPARHYHLPGGYIDLDMPADMVLVSDLENFNVLEVYIDGNLVAINDRACFEPKPLSAPTRITKKRWCAEDFCLLADGDRAKVRAIRIIPDQITSLEEIVEMKVQNGCILADPSRDLLYIVVVNRYEIAPPSIGIVRGFGLKRGGMASSVAHDSHNIIAVATGPNEMARVVNGVSEYGGYFATDGVSDISLPLPVAGLMSTENAVNVAQMEEEINNFVRSLGCELHAPFMTMGFQSLLVLPNLKIGDKGLFNSLEFKFVDPLIRE